MSGHVKRLSKVRPQNLALFEFGMSSKDLPVEGGWTESKCSVISFVNMYLHSF